MNHCEPGVALLLNEYKRSVSIQVLFFPYCETESIWNTVTGLSCVQMQLG